MIRQLVILAIAGMFGMSACSPSLQVSTDFNKQIDFATYKSFSFYKFNDKTSGISEANRNRIVNAISAELQKKGFTKDDSNPDILVNATALVKEMKYETGTNYYSYGGVYRPYFWGPGYLGPTQYNVSTFHDGSLIIDIIDASSKALVWEGTGNQEIDVPLKNPDDEISKFVTKVLADFPPGKSKK